MTSEEFNTDCLEYMRTLPDKAFQLAIADPPYGIGARLVDGGGTNGMIKYQDNTIQRNGMSIYPTKSFSTNWNVSARTASFGEAITSHCHRLAACYVGIRKYSCQRCHDVSLRGLHSTSPQR